MRAMRLHAAHSPLRCDELPVPEPAPGQILLRVKACGVCRTDLHVVDAELAPVPLPLTPGHEIVGIIERCGAGAQRFPIGARVGVPWLGYTCGVCEYCRRGLENLCERAGFTGYTLPGGYAEYVLADERYCFAIPDKYSDAEAAPLLCAGLIGYRAYRAAQDATRLGLYGFGAAAHLLAQLARAQGRRVFAFTRAGDSAAQEFARSLGVYWAGGSDELAPEPLDAAILFAPVGELIPAALAATRKAGRVICAGIHMSDIPSFPYRLLWGERQVCSVANLTRADGDEFMQIAARVAFKPAVELYSLQEANEALQRLRRGALQGAAVLKPAA